MKPGLRHLLAVSALIFISTAGLAACGGDDGSGSDRPDAQGQAQDQAQNQQQDSLPTGPASADDERPDAPDDSISDRPGGPNDKSGKETPVSPVSP